MRVLSLVAVAVLAVLAVVEPAFAQEAAVHGVSWTVSVPAAFGLAIAAFGGALGQGRIISTALESISRNPGASGQLFLPWFLGIVFVESLVVYVFVVGMITLFK